MTFSSLMVVVYMKSFKHLDSGLKLTHQESVLWPLVDPCYGCCQYAIQQQAIDK